MRQMKTVGLAILLVAAASFNPGGAHAGPAPKPQELSGEIESIQATNRQYLTGLADKHGANPTHSHADRIYDDLLAKVDAAGVASKVTAADKKIITREQALKWWSIHLQETEAARQKTSKPYRDREEAFFAELHQLTEADIRRALTGYDARFERKTWRSLQLANYLVDWLPEIALKASDLVTVQPLNLRRKTRAAVRAIGQRRNLTAEQLLAETLLHAVVRQSLGSEPIACKLFFEAASGLKAFGGAHIVHAKTGDELWLGRATVATANSYSEVIEKIVAELKYVLDAEFLKDERETILTLREPQHLLPTTLEAAFSRNAPIDDLIDALCIPILLGYDSSVLGGGYSEDYKEKLVTEVAAIYEALKSQLPTALKQVKVQIFLVPVECVKTLSQQFSDLIGTA